MATNVGRSPESYQTGFTRLYQLCTTIVQAHRQAMEMTRERARIRC